MPETLRVKTWQQFKELAHEKNAKTVVYVIAQSVPARNHTGLKLILPFAGGQYIFTDTAKGDKMRRTRISVRTDSKGNHFLTDQDIINFLKTNLEINGLKIFSYWTA
ncbi:MAG: hypothetical protein JW815_04675 [Candidatus Bathyarchaeota archaeon]|nr:hypothetical protein [Candidatus Bathyarchaeum sp.]